MKRKKKRIITFLFVFLFCFLLGGGYTLYCSFSGTENILFSLFENTNDKLKKIGYNQAEINQIFTLKEETIYQILKKEYQEDLTSYIKEKNFKEENLFQYIKEKEKSKLSIKETISLVNHKDYDENILYTNKMVTVLNGKYYISNNKERYFSYLEKQKNLDASMIITLVNANRDYEYYTNTKKTALTTTALVNKYTYLGKDDKPSDLVTQSTKYGAPNVQLSKIAYTAFQKMFDDAKKEGLTLYVNSAYRSYNSQKEVYQEYVVSHGKDASKYAAMPGYSEHQTGLALDIFKPGTTTKTFENTKEAAWLAKNAHKYGFILRYPKGKENITGYAYESWHYRYVGVDIAKKIFEENITFEEYDAFYNQ